MSFSTHTRDALDPALPLNNRMSHVRSCAMLIAQKYHIHRDAVIERVRQCCGVDIRVQGNESDARAAINVLVQIKDRGLNATPPPAAK